MKKGQPFSVDAKALGAVSHSRVLALDPSVFGSHLSLPLERPALELAEVDTLEGLVARRPAAAVLGAAGDDDEDDAPKHEAGSLVALVGVSGPLAQRGQEMLCGYIDGYDWIADRLEAALDEPAVGAVVLRIDSPGGDVAGAEAAIKRMRAAVDKSGKQVIAYVDEQAASAAYWLAAIVADVVMMPEAGQVGSIGCLGAWVDASAQLEADGLDVHMFRSPAGKAAAHPASPVAAVADERLETDVKKVATRFIGAMSKARGIPKKAVRGLNGGQLSGPEAVEFGLADEIGSLDDAINKAASSAAERSENMKSTKALEAMGLTADATPAELEAMLANAKLGATVLELTGQDTPEGAAGAVKAYKLSHESAVTERAALEADKQERDAAERVTLYRRQIVAGWRTPGTTWADAAESDTPGELLEHIATTPLEALRAETETLCATPRHPVVEAATGATPGPSATARIVKIGATAVGLSEDEVAECHQAAGANTEDREVTIQNYAAIKLRQGNTEPIRLEN